MEQESIQTYYEHDHDRLDEGFERYRRLKRENFAEAKQSFKTFFFGLKRHILWEEEILFPMFEDKTGMRDAGPTAVMRMEHRQIESLLDALHGKVRAGNPESDIEEEAILRILKPHNDKEESILYPHIDAHLTADEKRLVFAGMEGVPENRYNTCC